MRLYSVNHGPLGFHATFNGSIPVALSGVDIGVDPLRIDRFIGDTKSLAF